MHGIRNTEDFSINASGGFVIETRENLTISVFLSTGLCSYTYII